MAWVYVLLLVTAVAGGAYGVRSYNKALEEAERSKAATEEFRVAYEQLAASVQRLQQATNIANDLAAKRNSRAIAAERGREDARKELDELKKGNSDVKNWANTAVPDAIRLSLDAGASGTAASVSDTSNPNTSANPKP